MVKTKEKLNIEVARESVKTKRETLPFSRESFVKERGRVSGESGIPLWWQAVDTPTLSYKEFARDKKSRKLDDVEFSYDEPTFESGKTQILQIKNAKIKKKLDKKILSKEFNHVFYKGVNVVRGYRAADMRYFIKAVTRGVDKTEVVSGGVKYGYTILTKMDKNKLDKVIECDFCFMEYDFWHNVPSCSVWKYLYGVLGEKISRAKKYLTRMNLSNIDEFMKKKMRALNRGELARVRVTAALLSQKEVTVLCEPQRMLDMPARQTLLNLIDEWREINYDKTLVVLTSDKGVRE